jgi:hypothetical protein
LRHSVTPSPPVSIGTTSKYESYENNQEACKAAVPWLKELMKDNSFEEEVDYRSSRGDVVNFGGLERYPTIVRAKDVVNMNHNSPEAMLRGAFGNGAGDIWAVKRVRQYYVRRAAKESLKKLGVEDSTPHQVEIPIN